MFNLPDAQTTRILVFKLITLTVKGSATDIIDYRGTVLINGLVVAPIAVALKRLV